jgi:2-dehydropantoate 2-reductase
MTEIAERGTGTTTTELGRVSHWIGGEIVLLGRLHGVPTPVNAGLQRVARSLAASGAEPGSLTPDELATEVLI